MILFPLKGPLRCVMFQGIDTGDAFRVERIVKSQRGAIGRGGDAVGLLPVCVVIVVVVEFFLCVMHGDGRSILGVLTPAFR